MEISKIWSQCCVTERSTLKSYIENSAIPAIHLNEKWELDYEIKLLLISEARCWKMNIEQKGIHNP